METRKNLLQVVGDWLAERQTSAPAASRPPSRAGALLRWFLPNGGTLLLVALLIATQSLWARPAAAPNAPGPSATTVNYQGRLADSSGAPIDGTRGMTFALWDALTGGNLIWGPESHTAVPVSDGLFSVGLGSQTSGGIPTSAWNGDRYLEITVGGETLAPRELLRSVPVAGMALMVPDGSITTEKLDFRVPQLLGHKTCTDCGNTTETKPSTEWGWYSFKGVDAQDIIEVTATTHGGDVLVYITGRYQQAPAETARCHIRVSQGGNTVQRAHIDGINLPTSDFSCSGSYLFDGLPAGTYTFTAQGWASEAVTSITWWQQRQIVVYEY